MTPSLRGLRVFCEAARNLSFKAAGDSLFITASAVSHQIKSLEQEFDTELFVRGTRTLSLTPEGAALFERIDPLLAEIRDVCGSLFPTGKPVPVRFAAPPFFATEHLIPRLGNLLPADAGYAFEVATIDGRPDRHPDNAHIAVLLADKAPVEHRSRSLFELELVPACAPALAERLKAAPMSDWMAETLIVHSGRANAWRHWFRQHGLKLTHPDKVMVLDSMFAVARAAEQGLGVALVPVALARKWFASGSLVRLAPAVLPTGDAYYLSWQQLSGTALDLDGLSDQIANALARD